MIHVSLGKKHRELLPDGIDDVWWDGGHGEAPSHREALRTPRMMKHSVPVYTSGVFPIGASSNPTARVKKAAQRGQTRMHVLSEEEASRLVSVAKGTRDEALIMVALKTFMRQGELAALRWEDV